MKRRSKIMVPYLQRLYLETLNQEIGIDELDARIAKAYKDLSIPRNDLVGSILNYNFTDDTLYAVLRPVRYKVRVAFQKVYENYNLNEEEAIKINPGVAGMALILPVKYKQNYWLLGQIKGKALGSGQVHPALFAGGFTIDDILSNDPIKSTLKHEAIEEVGLKLDYVNGFKYLWFMEEFSSGHRSIAVTTYVDIDTVLENYSKRTEKDEVKALALIRLPKCDKVLKLDTDGSVINLENPIFRPPMDAIIYEIENNNYDKYILERGGL